MVEQDEVHLIRRCQQGDFDAFTTLYNRHSRRALRTAYLITQSVPEAQDAVQESFIQVWRRIGWLRSAQSFQSWFYRILVHEASRTLRRARWSVLVPWNTRQHDKPDTRSLMPEEYLIRSEENQLLYSALNELSHRHRAVVALRYFTGLSEAEVSEVLNIPVGTVKSRLYNARVQLQRVLSPISLEEPENYQRGVQTQGGGES